MPKTIEITIEQAKQLLEEKRDLYFIAVRDGNPLVGPIIGWECGCENGDTVRCGPLLFPWIAHERNTWPFRYMTVREGQEVTLNPALDESKKKVLPSGTRVKIVMVSRLGDVGITDILTAETGYSLRVYLANLETQFTDFSNEP